MFARSLGLLATTAVATNAFLLPPDVSSATVESANKLAALGIVDPENQLVNVHSGQCVDRDGDCSLILNFSTAGSSETLLINGVPFYTSNPSETANAMNTPVMITQLDESETLVDYVASPDAFVPKQLRLTGSSFEVGVPDVEAETGETILPMNFQIYSLNGQAVNVPLVALKVLKGAGSNLIVLAVDILPVDPMANPEDKMCADWPMVCQMRDFLLGKANAAKEGIRKICGGKSKGKSQSPHRGPPVRLPHPHHQEGPPSHGYSDDMLPHPHGKHGDRPHPHGEDGDRPHPHGDHEDRPHPHGKHDGKPHPHGENGDRPPRPHGEHRRPHGEHAKHKGHRHHHKTLSPANIAIMLVSGIMMLVVTWTLGYVLGTVIGYLIVGLWLLYRRAKGTPRYRRVANDEDSALAGEEKIVVEDEEQAPAAIPKEDPPAYEEKQVVG